MSNQPQITSISINGRLTLNMHSLNNEGGEGNQILTRTVSVVDAKGQLVSVNAISGDMFKHIQANHLINVLQEAGLPLCNACQVADPNRISNDKTFTDTIKKGTLDRDVVKTMIETCAVDDLEGILITEGRNTARKSTVEFGWVIGIPEQNITENFFHVKFVQDSKKVKEDADEEAVKANKGQAIYHRPANSGVYATVLHLETARIGFNDYSREYNITAEDRQKRYQALLKSVLYTFMNPEGAMRNTQNPHVVNFEGVISYSTTSIPAPTVSALKAGYAEEISEIGKCLNELEGGKEVIVLKQFDSMSTFVKEMTELIKTTSPGTVGGTHVAQS